MSKKSQVELQEEVGELFSKYRITGIDKDRFTELLQVDSIKQKSLIDNKSDEFKNNTFPLLMNEYSGCIRNIIEDSHYNFKLQDFISDITGIAHKYNPGLRQPYDIAIAISLSSIINDDYSKLHGKENAYTAYHYIDNIYKHGIDKAPDIRKPTHKSILQQFYEEISYEFNTIDNPELKKPMSIKERRLMEFDRALLKLERVYKQQVFHDGSAFYNFMMNNETSDLVKKLSNTKKEKSDLNIKVQDLIYHSPPELMKKIVKVSEGLLSLRENKQKKAAHKGVGDYILGLIQKFCDYITRSSIPKDVAENLKQCGEYKSPFTQTIDEANVSKPVRTFVEIVNKGKEVRLDPSKGFREMVDKQRAVGSSQEKKIG